MIMVVVLVAVVSCGGGCIVGVIVVAGCLVLLGLGLGVLKKRDRKEE